MSAGYAEIAARYRAEIAEGRLRPGDRLPTLRAVMREYGVAQQTASRAYGLLRDEGLTVASTGGGTAVATTARTLGKPAASSGEVAGELEYRVLDVGRAAADEAVAVRLGVEPGTRVTVSRRLATRAGAPVLLTASYSSTPAPGNGPPGSAPADVVQEVTSRLATDPERQALDLDGFTVVTQIVRSDLLPDGRAAQVTVTVAAGSTTFTWSGPAQLPR